MSTSLMSRNGFSSINPWNVLSETEKQMWDWLNTPTNLTPLNRIVGGSTSYVPPIDVYETDEAVHVAASLPGIDPSKVDVQVHDGLVTISGEQTPIFAPAEGTNYKQHLSGIRHYGKFDFRLKLPCEVLSEQAQAVLNDGILRLQFPKTPAAKPARIAINVAGRPAEVAARAQEQIEARQDSNHGDK